jgi:ribokinase
MPEPGVTVVGSFAVGLTLRAARWPVAGETVLASDFDQGPGGKGSNQAVQVARMGIPVQFVAVIGEDALGDIALELYKNENVGTTHVRRSADRNTGVGFIILDTHGENRILLDPGANELLSTTDIERAHETIGRSRVLITQLEISTETAAAALRAAHNSDTIAILNPAPARPLEASLLEHCDIVTPNQSEARTLLDLPPDDPIDDLDLCGKLLARGVRAVVLTRGANGALIATADGSSAVPAPTVDVTDTTGAGDAFNGTLAAALGAGTELLDAVERAAAAGALACTRLGVIPGLPTRAALDSFLTAVSQ